MNQYKKLAVCLRYVPACLTVFFCLMFSGSSAESNRIARSARRPSGETQLNTSPFKFEGDRPVSFKGGDSAWFAFLKENLNAEVPVKRKAPVGEYTVLVRFIVTSEGVLENIKTVTNHGYGMEEEAIRILKKSPRWNPAIKKGKYVRTICTQPIVFKVKDERQKGF